MILDLLQLRKRLFNPKSRKDIVKYKEFLRDGGWGAGGCPFVLVFPYMTIPDMIQDKIVYNILGVKNDKSRY